MDAINKISSIGPTWFDVKDSCENITANTVREAAADHIVGNAQITANQWGGRSDTLLTCMVGYWMFSYIAVYTSLMALKFAASVSAYKASEGIVTSPFVKPVTSTVDVLTRTTAVTASLAKGMIAAQFEGENEDYRPSLGDVGRSIVNTGVTNLVFSPKTAMVGA